jgi:hypothetical protein
LDFADAATDDDAVLKELKGVVEDLGENNDSGYVFGEQHEVPKPEGVDAIGDIGVDELEQYHLCEQAVLVVIFHLVVFEVSQPRGNWLEQFIEDCDV